MKNSETFQQKEYVKYVEKKSPKSNLLKDCIRAFIVGGAFSVLGQTVIWYAKDILHLSEKGVSAFTAIVMVFIGATLTGVGIYDKIGKFAGAGSIVPITGFANSIVAPAMEFKKEGLVVGVGSKMFTIAGPVLVYGIGTSVIVGFIYFLGRM